MRKVLITGATSAIAQATARLLAARGDKLMLCGRNESRLQSIADDLRTLGAAQVETFVMDARDRDQHATLLATSTELLGGLDMLLLAQGTLSNQQQCQTDLDALYDEFDTNTLSVISLLTLAANQFEQQGHGSLITLSSVAGDRGRQSNYVYGSAKAAVSTFTAGLRNRLARKGVQVLTVKPGFVDTPMTAEFKKGPLWASPETIAKGIIRAVEKGHDVAYLPGFWSLIMRVIRAIPEPIFKRLSL